MNTRTLSIFKPWKSIRRKADKRNVGWKNSIFALSNFSNNHEKRKDTEFCIDPVMATINEQIYPAWNFTIFYYVNSSDFTWFSGKRFLWRRAGLCAHFSRYLENNWNGSKKEGAKSAIIFTYNDMTKYFASEIISLWHNFGIIEFVLFKNPSKAPYLCSYPSLQKGFKRPPPI